jgi:hypothetical protein
VVCGVGGTAVGAVVVDPSVVVDVVVLSSGGTESVVDAVAASEIERAALATLPSSSTRVTTIVASTMPSP